MSKPESFVRATKGELQAWAFAMGTPWWETLLAALRDAVVAEKDAEFASERIGTRDNLDALRARAERAEAEVARLTREREAQKARGDAIAKDRDEWLATARRVDKERAAAKSALADAQRAGAWEALTRYGQSVPTLTAMASAYKFRDTHYAPPAPEPPSAWELTVFTKQSGELSYQYVTITPEAAKRIVALAEEAK